MTVLYLLRCVITLPEATNTGPGFYRGSGGGVLGCGFEERVGAWLFPIAHDFCVSACLSMFPKVTVYFSNLKSHNGRRRNTTAATTTTTTTFSSDA